MTELFDGWPEKYDHWFETPIGRLVKGYGQELISRVLDPQPGEMILDAGCGTGIFVGGFIGAGAPVIGLELSRVMLHRSLARFADRAFYPVQGDMVSLAFADYAFHRTVSNTAIEFVQDAGSAIAELFRVTRPGRIIVVTTLNSLSPWAVRRRKAQEGHPLFGHVVFRSPADLLELSPVEGRFKTAIHFGKDDDPPAARQMEEAGRKGTWMQAPSLPSGGKSRCTRAFHPRRGPADPVSEPHPPSRPPRWTGPPPPGSEEGLRFSRAPVSGGAPVS